MFNIFKKKPETARETLAEEPQVSIVAETTQVDEPAKSWTERLKQGLAKTRKQFGGQLTSLFGGGKIDAETYDELETILLTSDIGVAATQKLLDNLKKRVKRENLEDTTALKAALKAELLAVLVPLEVPLRTNIHAPFVLVLQLRKSF